MPLRPAEGCSERAETNLEGVELPHDDTETALLLSHDLIEGVDLHKRLFDGRLVLGGSDDVLEVLEQSLLVLVGGLGLHLSDGLDLSLERQKSARQVFSSNTCLKTEGKYAPEG